MILKRSAMVSAAIPVDLRDELEQSARRHDRSLSGELREALRAYLQASHSSIAHGAGGRVEGDGASPDGREAR
jgi:plasmid stability protein